MTDLNQLFNLKSFRYKELFNGLKYPWQALPKLKPFIKNNLGKIKGKRLQAEIHPTAIIGDQVYIGPGTVVAPFCFIKGPAIIGKNCQIGPSAYIRENVIIGNNSVIGNSSEVKNSVLISQVFASHFAYIGDSMLGSQIELGAGARLANFRFDQKEILINLNGRKISTKLKKLGAIIGDNTSIGCNAVLNPGTILGKKSIVYPTISVSGVQPQNSIIKA